MINYNNITRIKIFEKHLEIQLVKLTLFLSRMLTMNIFWVIKSSYKDLEIVLAELKLINSAIFYYIWMNQMNFFGSFR